MYLYVNRCDSSKQNHKCAPKSEADNFIKYISLNSLLLHEVIDFSVRGVKPTQFTANKEDIMLNNNKLFLYETVLRKNTVETYDHMFMKFDTPSYEGEFFDVKQTKSLEYPTDTPALKDTIFL